LSDIGNALAHGDTVGRGLVVAAAQLVADAAARIVNLYNPGLILIGGSVAHLGEVYLSPRFGKLFWHAPYRSRRVICG
jgi:predicted NBD/HSP70 family sugar kinase